MACRYTYQGKTYEAHEFDDVLRAMAPEVAAKYMSGVESAPSAPFAGKTDAWTSLLIKRLLRYAAEGGYDAISWTRGDQQVERYTSALRKAVDVIEWKKTPEGVHLIGYKGQTERIKSVMTGEYIPSQRLKVVDTTEAESALSDAIGKSMADKIRNDPNQTGTIEGDGITVSDTGMAGYYDRIVPKIVGELAKKLGGGKVTQIDIQTGNAPADVVARYPDNEAFQKANTPQSQPSIIITPQMREKILGGLPLFTRGAQQSASMSAAVESALAPAIAKLKIPATVWGTVQEAREATGRDIPPDARGMFSRGEVHIFAENNADALTAEQSFWHEIFHAGINRLYGIGSRGYKQALTTLALKNRNIREAAKEWRTRYGKDALQRAKDYGMDDAEAARYVQLQGYDEALANLSGANAKISGLKQFLAAAQKFLRSIGLERLADAMEGKSDAEALSLIAQARRSVMVDGAHVSLGETAAAFDRGGQPQGIPAGFRASYYSTGQYSVSGHGLGGVGDTLEAAVDDVARQLEADARREGAPQKGEQAKALREWVARGPEVDTRFSQPMAGAINAVMRSPKLVGVMDAIASSPASFGIFKGLNSQYHKAVTLARRGRPQFKAVFDKMQDFINDTTAIATDAEQEGQAIFRELKGIGAQSFVKYFKGAASEADIQAIGPWLNHGTLYGGASPMDGIIWTDKELRGDFSGSMRVRPRIAPLTEAQVPLYHQALAVLARSIEHGAKAVMYRHVRKYGIQFDKMESLGTVAGDVRDQLGAIRLRMQRVFDDVTASADERYEAYQEADSASKAAPKDRQLRITAENMRAQYEQAQKDVDRAQADIDGVDALLGSGDEPGMLKKIQDQANGLIAAGYMPLKRFGNRTVTSRDQNGKVTFFGAFDGTPLVPGSANAEMARTAREIHALHPNWTVTTGVRDESSWKMFNGLSIDALENFIDLLDPETRSEIAKDEVVQEYLRNAVNNRSVMKELIHRKGTPGFSKDVSRVLASFVTSHARNASGLYNIADAKALVQQIPQEQGDVRGEAVDLIEYVTKPGEEAAKLRGFLFFHFLGGSIASAAVNLTQTPLMTASYLTQYASAKDVTARILAAMKLAVMDPESIKGAAGDALQRAEREGITAPQQIHHLIATASNNPFSSNRSFRSFMAVWGGMFGSAEVFNRRVAFLSAFEIGKSNGMDDAAAYDFAKRTVEETQLIYNKGNKSNAGRGALGGVVMTFKAYSIGYLELIKRLPPQQQLMMLGMLMLVAGVEGLPFAEDIEDVIDTIGQWLGFSTNTGKWIGKQVRDTIGPEFERPILKGLGGMLPIDLHSRLGMANLIPGTAFFKPSEIDKTRDVAEAVGPIGSVVKSLMDSLALLARGKWDAAAVGIAPKAVRDLYNGMHMAATGESQDTQGRLAMRDVTAGEAFGKAIGFNPQRAAIESEAKREQQQDKNLRTVRMDEIASDWADGIIRKDADKTRDAASRLRQWNSENPTLRIDGNQMLQSVRERVKAAKMTSAQRFEKAVPKPMKVETREALRQ